LRGWVLPPDKGGLRRVGRLGGAGLTCLIPFFSFLQRRELGIVVIIFNFQFLASLFFEIKN